MKIQQLLIGQHGQLIQDEGFCNEVCHMRDQCSLQLLDMLQKEGPDVIDRLSTTPTQCPIDGIPCVIQVNKIILDS